LETHGQGAGGAGRILGSDEQGNLYEAQAAAEIEVKGGERGSRAALTPGMWRPAFRQGLSCRAARQVPKAPKTQAYAAHSMASAQL